MSDNERFQFGWPEEQILKEEIDDSDASAVFRQVQWVFDPAGVSEDSDEVQVKFGIDSDCILPGNWSENGVSYPGVFRNEPADEPVKSDQASSPTDQESNDAGM